MGDANLGVFVSDQVVECLCDELVPLADLLTPNQFEVGLIAGCQLSTWRELEAAALKIQAQRGARLVATGCTLSDTPDGSLENIVFEDQSCTRLTSLRLPMVPVGRRSLHWSSDRKPGAGSHAGRRRAPRRRHHPRRSRTHHGRGRT